MDPSLEEEEEDAEGEAPAAEGCAIADVRLPLRVTAKLTRAPAMTSSAASLSASAGRTNLLRVTGRLTNTHPLGYS